MLPESEADPAHWVRSRTQFATVRRTSRYPTRLYLVRGVVLAASNSQNEDPLRCAVRRREVRIKIDNRARVKIISFDVIDASLSHGRHTMTIMWIHGR